MNRAAREGAGGRMLHRRCGEETESAAFKPPTTTLATPSLPASLLRGIGSAGHPPPAEKSRRAVFTHDFAGGPRRDRCRHAADATPRRRCRKARSPSAKFDPW